MYATDEYIREKTTDNSIFGVTEETEIPDPALYQRAAQCSDFDATLPARLDMTDYVYNFNFRCAASTTEAPAHAHGTHSV